MQYCNVPQFLSNWFNIVHRYTSIRQVKHIFMFYIHSVCLIAWKLPLLAHHKDLSNYVFITILNIHLIFHFHFTFIGSNCLFALLSTTGSVRYSLHSICIMLWIFNRPWVSYLIKLGYFLFICHVRNAKVCIFNNSPGDYSFISNHFCCFLLFSMKSSIKLDKKGHFHTWNRELFNNIPSAHWKRWTGKNDAT